ncbi:MAG: hypothetical protein GC190_00025 [Alphaproteobacteria bacterium]|nr:hypothetical protein [Alphaproteobacteria bacterium]
MFNALDLFARFMGSSTELLNGIAEQINRFCELCDELGLIILQELKPATEAGSGAVSREGNVHAQSLNDFGFASHVRRSVNAFGVHYEAADEGSSNRLRWRFWAIPQGLVESTKFWHE